METVESSTYVVPVVDAELGPIRSTEALDRDDQADQDEDQAGLQDENRETTKVTVSRVNTSSGPDRLTATTFADGDRKGHYPFVVTDEKRAQCAYTRSDKETVPPAVRRAIMLFGFYDTTAPEADTQMVTPYMDSAYLLVRHYKSAAEGKVAQRAWREASKVMYPLIQAVYLMLEFDGPADVPTDAFPADKQDSQSDWPTKSSWADVDLWSLSVDLVDSEWYPETNPWLWPPSNEEIPPGSVFDRSVESEESDRQMIHAVDEWLEVEVKEEALEAPSDVEDQPSIWAEVIKPDEPQEGDYINVVVTGKWRYAYYPFRVTKSKADDQEGTVVLETDHASNPFPHIATMSALSEKNWVVENVPQFPVDATQQQVRANIALLFQRLLKKYRESSGIGTSDFTDMVAEGLIPIWLVTVLESTITPESTDNLARAIVDTSGSASLSDALEDMDNDTLCSLLVSIASHLPEETAAKTEETAFDTRTNTMLASGVLHEPNRETMFNREEA